MHLVLLSPHRDDAAFSCGLLLTRLLRSGVSVTLVNILTRSDYAPYLQGTGTPRVEQVSAVRRAEDLDFLAALQQAAESGPCTMVDLGWLDSPLRLGIATDQVLGARETAQAEVNDLVRALQPWSDADAVLAPLGLGHHVDHRLVRDAACAAFSTGQLGFYQDLPYGCWMTEDERSATTAAITQTLGHGALPCWNANLAVPSRTAATGFKLHYARCYPSQIADSLAQQMEADAAKRYGGETMCLPATLADSFTARLRARQTA